jgi:elongation factor P
MLQYNQITAGKVIVFNNEPHKVLSHHVFRMQQRKPVNVTKLKSIVTGKVVEYSFHQTEKMEEAELEKRSVVFIYKKGNDYMFHTEGNAGDRFPITEDMIGDTARFMRAGDTYQALLFNEEVIGIEIPIKVQLTVKDAPPAVKGNTATGATKVVTLETGATVTTPLFVNAGDVIEVNTETGEYATRVEKA